MTRLANRYELRHVVGRGGMSRVWAARDVRSGRDVAVKTADVDAEMAGRLHREAALTASIDHPGVVDVHDSGHDGATAYLVMDLLPGPDLAEVLRDGPVPAREALRIAAGVADALAAAHGAGVVHGDVKPANVVVTDDDVVLIDFGVAATAGDAGGAVTFGTAPYMAPEQVISAPLTPAADVYALGCLLTATVAGRPPFTADCPTELLHRHVRGTPPRLGELVDDVPSRLEELVARMLDKDPGRRGSAAHVRDVLTELLEDAALDLVEPRQRAQPRLDGLDPEATLPALVMLTGDAVEVRRAA